MAKKIIESKDGIVIEKEIPIVEELEKSEVIPEEVIGKFTNEERMKLKENYPVSNKSFKENSGHCRICGISTNLPERILCYNCFKKYKDLI